MFQRLITWLLQQDVKADNEEDNRRAQLLAGILLATLVAGILIVGRELLRSFANIEALENQAAIAGIIIVSGLYIANRRGYTQIAALALIVVLMVIFVFFPLLAGLDAGLIGFAGAPILIAGMFFSLQGSLIVAAIEATVLILGPSIDPTLVRPNLNVLSYSVPFVGALIAVFIRHLNGLELVRRQTLEEANAQLRESETLLEHRVAARTADLATSSEIVAAANQIRERDELISLSVNLIRDRFDFYYVQVYLLDSVREYAVLADGTGYVGRRLLNRNHKLPLNGRSLVATAIRDGRMLVVQDTRSDSRWLPNDLLPETRSEIVIPLRTKEEIIGVLDIQHSVSNAFDDAQQQLFQTLADQIAISFENVTLLDDAETLAREMATVAEVGIESSTNLDTRTLLRSVVKLTRDNFKLYHAHIYLLDEAGENLVLAAGAGEAGMLMMERGHSIPLNREISIVATSARTGEGVIVNDVTKTPNHLPNPLLPDTRSELAVPLKVGSQIIGVLDVQSDQENRFDEQDSQVLTTLASQVAVAIQNARTFEAVQSAQHELATSQALLDRALSGTSDGIWDWDLISNEVYFSPRWKEMLGYEDADLVNSFDTFASLIHPDDQQYAQKSIEDYLADRVPNYEIEIRMKQKEGGWRWILSRGGAQFNEQSQKVRLSGTHVDIQQRKEDEGERQTLFEVSNMLGDARNPDEVLNAVLHAVRGFGVDTGTLFYLKNDEAGDPQYMENAATWHTPNVAAVPVGMSFYLPEFESIRTWLDDPDNPVFYEDTQTDSRTDEATRGAYRQFGVRGATLLPLNLHNRWIGTMIFGWADAHVFTDREKRLFSAIKNQVTSTVEALRSGEEIRRRAAELETVARVSAATTTLLSVDDLLKSVADLTKENFELYHAHIYLYDEETQSLVLAGGAGAAGDMMKQQGHRISMENPNSVVVRAAKTREGVIVNDVRQSPTFLPNQMLPDTRSELAVPMIVGDDLIGVLDVQSDRIGRFTTEDVLLKTTLADQVAVAVRNAQAFERERKTVERLKEVDRLKQEFLANMSHELRTPLNSIIGYSEVLIDGVDGDLPEEAIEDVHAIHNSGKHLLSIINEILDLAKIDAGQMQLSRKPLNFPSLIQDLVHSSQILVKEKPVEMRLQEIGTVRDIYADPIRLNQIMLNLIGNAVKFTNSGSITVRYGMADDDHIRVEVIDTGIGMSPEQLAVIFERFRQVDGSSTRRAGGTGLGLTITRQLVEMHGGRIGVESEVGKGTTFWFILPTVEMIERIGENGKMLERVPGD